MTQLRPPIAFADIPPEWFEAARSAINVHEGQEIRRHASAPKLEVRSVNTGRWHELMLFGSGFEFASVEDRDAAFAKLEGR